MSTLFIFRILVGQLTVAVVVIYWHFVAVIFSELFCCWSSVENCDRKTKQQLKLVAFVLKSIPISRVACSESDYWIFLGVVFFMGIMVSKNSTTVLSRPKVTNEH